MRSSCHKFRLFNYTLRIRIAVSLRSQVHDVSKARSYAYQSLQTNEIRLLDLHPGCDLDPIQCTLRNVALINKPSYESLSYCWGKVRGGQEIRCGNRPISVMPNLYDALLNLRRKGVGRTLWVDAICINQANIAERGQQVGIMRQIFQASDCTIVWLGQEDENSPRAVELIRQLAQVPQDHQPSIRGPHVTESLPPLYDVAWGAFAALLKRPWWHRAWIVQEASVTRDITLVCGHDTFTWYELEQAVKHAVDLGFFVAYGGSATFQAFSLFQTRANFQSKHRPPLHDVLLQHRSFLATDPRDKVFGLLSLADEANVAAMGIQPDYNQSSDELFTTVTTSLLAQQNLGAFKGAGIHDKSSEPDLPSWVADWSVSDPAVPLGTSVAVDHGHISPHAVSSNPHFCPSNSNALVTTISSDHKTLGLQVMKVDQIQAVGVLSRTRYLRHVSHMFELFVQCHDVLEQLKDWESIALVGSREPYPSGGRRRDAYWHTLCAGHVSPGLVSARQDPRYKYYILFRALRRLVRLTIRWFPRSTQNTWYNRFFYKLFQTARLVLGQTPTKIQRIGFPPESRLPNYRRMARTEKGYLALVPRLTKEGDWVVICKGGQLPLIVRRDGRHWVLVGESYVHGIMNGEVWDERRCEEVWLH